MPQAPDIDIERQSLLKNGPAMRGLLFANRHAIDGIV